MGKFARKIAEALVNKKKSKAKTAEVLLDKMTPEQRKKAFIPVGGCKRPDPSKPRTVLKAAVKPKVLEQTPTGMANSTKSSPYIPPAKKTTKPNL